MLKVKKKPPLRIPSGWKDQARAFVIQLQQTLDDIYSKLEPGEAEELAGIVTDAQEYSPEKTYGVGDRAIHNGSQWECTTAILVPEEWTVAHWDELPSVQEQIEEIEAGIHVGAYTWGELADQ